MKLGQAVAKHLRAAGIVVDETRTSDATLSLDERVKIELKRKYDYFISFHRNAFKPEQATGAEVFVYRAYNAKSKASEGNPASLSKHRFSRPRGKRG